VNKCIDCGRLNTDESAEVCPSCGGRLNSTDPVSVADDRLDELVQQASKPNLAALFGQAKKAGHIKAAYSYGGPVS
jgi:predicted  nucleic acid-binding Zn-ribbon protein